MIKKLVGVSLAAIVAINLWSSVPPTAKRLLEKIHRLELRYKNMVAWSLKED